MWASMISMGRSLAVEQVAAAFVRKHFSDQAAPEELLDTVPPTSEHRSRDAFNDSVWFSLSVGRDQNAEPRWLLPMLCRTAHLTKRDIGAIRVQAGETFVEFAAACVDKFVAALGPENTIEETITVTRLDGAPSTVQEPQAEAAPKPRQKKEPFAGGKPRKPIKPKPRAAEPEEKPVAKKPWEKTPKKSKEKKRKGKLGNLDPRFGGQGKPGSAPLKRKKPKTD